MRLEETLPQVFAAALSDCFSGKAPAKIGIALSGGGDSTALLVLLAEWAVSKDVALCAVTINHGLRVEAANEARKAGALCAKLGVAHQTIQWENRPDTGNFQDGARQARIRLISAWAAGLGVETVAMGHTKDDQAETVLMRLARGSGVDGLAGMAASVDRGGVRWIRPLLATTRAELRAYLTAKDIGWADDPSNEDLKYDRVKARAALAGLAEVGVTMDGLVDTAAQMARARHALEEATHDLSQRIATVGVCGDVMIERDEFLGAPAELHLRLLAHALKWISSAAYRPRLKALSLVLEAIRSGGVATLSGCKIDARAAESITIARESGATVPAPLASGKWDSRWAVEAKTTEFDTSLEIAALGETGLSQCPEWRETGLSRVNLLSSPALWQGETLIAALLAGNRESFDCRLINGANHFYSSILTH